MDQEDQPMDLTSQTHHTNSGSAEEPVKDETESIKVPIGQQHDTVLYHGDDAVKTVEKQDDDDAEDDSFYDVTMDDVKSVYKDRQRRRDELENAPLQGQKLRALEKEKGVLKSLHDHPNTAIRVRFPDRYVLQGIFRTSDTIGSVKSWLRELLQDTSLEFYLFTAPPKKVLQDDVKLVEEGLVAMAVIYFGSENLATDARILKSDLYSRISDPDQSFQHAKTKLRVRKSETNDGDSEIKPSVETQPKDHSESSSSSQQPVVRRTIDKGKVPKWFKMK